MMYDNRFEYLSRNYNPVKVLRQFNLKIDDKYLLILKD